MSAKYLVGSLSAIRDRMTVSSKIEAEIHEHKRLNASTDTNIDLKIFTTQPLSVRQQHEGLAGCDLLHAKCRTKDSEEHVSSSCNIEESWLTRRG